MVQSTIHLIEMGTQVYHFVLGERRGTGDGESDLSKEAGLAELQHVLLPQLWVAFRDSPMGRPC